MQEFSLERRSFELESSLAAIEHHAGLTRQYGYLFYVLVLHLES